MTEVFYEQGVRACFSHSFDGWDIQAATLGGFYEDSAQACMSVGLNLYYSSKHYWPQNIPLINYHIV